MVKRGHLGCRARRGSAAMEAVLTTAVLLPIAAALLTLGIRACRALYRVIATSVDWPYL